MIISGMNKIIINLVKKLKWKNLMIFLLFYLWSKFKFINYKAFLMISTFKDLVKSIDIILANTLSKKKSLF